MSLPSNLSWFDPRRLLSVPAVYSFHSKLVGPDSYKARYVETVLGIGSGDCVLDIGCGTGDILRFLPDVTYFGFDGDAEYIELARERHGNAGRFEHRYVSPDALEDLPPFDVAIASGVVHHLNDEDARILFRTAFDALKPGGRLVTCDGTFVKGQNPLARTLISFDRGEFVRTPDAYRALAADIFPDVDMSIRSDLLRMPYTHCVLTCQKPVEVE